MQDKDDFTRASGRNKLCVLVKKAFVKWAEVEKEGFVERQSFHELLYARLFKG